MLGQLLQGGIGLIMDQLAQALAVGLVQGGGMAAAMGLGRQPAAGITVLQQADDEGQTDAEAAGDLPQGTFVVIDLNSPRISTGASGLGSHMSC